MSNWNDIAREVDKLEERRRKQDSPIDAVRRRYINKLSDLRGRNVICYYSGWLQGRQGPEVSISDNDMDGLMNAMSGLDRNRGLDLILHTPGGALGAAEAIVEYLRDCFPDDVCAIVPQIAMSAGTMIACSCNEVLMGRQSSLGPTDPQLNGLPASGIIDEFKRAKQEVTDNPSTLGIWAQIVQKYHPTLLGECENALEASEGIVRRWLRDYMFRGDADAEAKANEVAKVLCDHKSSAMHSRHFSHRRLEEIGMKVTLIEGDNDLQDAVLSVHHAFMTTMQRYPVSKIIENNLGQAWVIKERTDLRQ